MGAKNDQKIMGFAELIPSVLSMYMGEPCRVCAKKIKQEDLTTIVFAGYSRDFTSRAAHLPCWNKGIPVSEWVTEKAEADECKNCDGVIKVNCADTDSN